MIRIPWSAVRQMIVERVQLILFDDLNIRQMAMDAVAKREINQAVCSRERNGGFRALLGQDFEAAAFASG